MKTFEWISVCALACSFGLVGCGDDDGETSSGTGASGTGGGGDGGTGNTGGGTGAAGGDGGMGGAGGVAVVEVPIDRLGRAAVNTALTDRFSDGHDAAAETYNVNHDDTTWVTDYAPGIASNIAIYDAIDTVCMNQFLSCDDETDPTCYDAFAGVLANDKLWVKTTYTSCDTYLGVEADATNALPNEDCGGRRPVDDVIERTYSLLVTGGLAGTDDVIAVEPETAAAAAAFPYMGPPNNN